MQGQRKTIVEPAFALWKLAPRYVLMTALRRFVIALLAFFAFGALLMAARDSDHPRSLRAIVAGGAAIAAITSLIAIGVLSVAPQEAVIEDRSLLLTQTRWIVRKFHLDAEDTVATLLALPTGNLLEVRSRGRRYLMAVADSDLEVIAPLLAARSDLTAEP